MENRISLSSWYEPNNPDRSGWSVEQLVDDRLIVHGDFKGGEFKQALSFAKKLAEDMKVELWLPNGVIYTASGKKTAPSNR